METILLNKKKKSIEEYLFEDILFNKYPEINKIEKDIKTFFLNN
jgi:hypothetical protein